MKAREVAGAREPLIDVTKLPVDSREDVFAVGRRSGFYIAIATTATGILVTSEAMFRAMSTAPTQRGILIDVPQLSELLGLSGFANFGFDAVSARLALGSLVTLVGLLMIIASLKRSLAR